MDGPSDPAVPCMPYSPIVTLIVVALGGAMGGALRFFVSGVVARLMGETFPWGTMVVNVSGSLLLGLFMGAAAGGSWAEPHSYVGPFAAAGLLGGYTTVSSLSLQTLTLLEGGERNRALGNLLLTIGAGILAMAAGVFAGLRWLPGWWA